MRSTDVGSPGQGHGPLSDTFYSSAEAGDTILLVLSSPAGATLGRAAGTITILDDD